MSLFLTEINSWALFPSLATEASEAHQSSKHSHSRVLSVRSGGMRLAPSIAVANAAKPRAAANRALNERAHRQPQSCASPPRCLAGWRHSVRSSSGPAEGVWGSGGTKMLETGEALLLLPAAKSVRRLASANGCLGVGQRKWFRAASCWHDRGGGRRCVDSPRRRKGQQGAQSADDAGGVSSR